MTTEKKQIKALAKRSIISEYIMTFEANTQHAPSINTREMERQLRACAKWMHNVEARTRLFIDDFKLRWGNISPEMMLHYFYYLDKKADRHAERVARNEESMRLLIDFYDWLNYEYGNQKLLNAPAVAYQMFRQSKRKSA